MPLPVRIPLQTPSAVPAKGTTKDGEIIQAALRTPKRTGSVLHPPRASPSMSAKSFVVEAPRRNNPMIAPMNHGSSPAAVFTDDHPATFNSTPRGIAIVMFAVRPRCFVLNGGTE